MKNFASIFLVILFFSSASFGSENSKAWEDYFKTVKRYCKYFKATKTCNGDEDPKLMAKYEGAWSDNYNHWNGEIVRLKSLVTNEIMPFAVSKSGVANVYRSPEPEEVLIYEKSLMELDKLSRSDDPSDVIAVSILADSLQKKYDDFIFSNHLRLQTDINTVTANLGPIGGYLLGAAFLNRADAQRLSSSQKFSIFRKLVPLSSVATLLPVLASMATDHQRMRLGEGLLAAPAHYIQFNASVERMSKPSEDVLAILKELKYKQEISGNAALLAGILAPELGRVGVATSTGALGVVGKAAKFARLTPMTFFAGLALDQAARFGVKEINEAMLRSELTESFKGLDFLAFKNEEAVVLAKGRTFKALNTIEAYYLQNSLSELRAWVDLSKKLYGVRDSESLGEALRKIFYFDKSLGFLKLDGHRDSLRKNKTLGFKEAFCRDLSRGFRNQSFEMVEDLVSRLRLGARRAIDRYGVLIDELENWEKENSSLVSDEGVRRDIFYGRLIELKGEYEVAKKWWQQLDEMDLYNHLKTYERDVYGPMVKKFNFGSRGEREGLLETYSCFGFED